MSETLKEYARKRMPELLKDVPPEERLEGLSGEQIYQALSPEQVKALETLLRQHKTNGSAGTSP